VGRRRRRRRGEHAEEKLWSNQPFVTRQIDEPIFCVEQIQRCDVEAYEGWTK
jgi:hypothetical protein